MNTRTMIAIVALTGFSGTTTISVADTIPLYFCPDEGTEGDWDDSDNWDNVATCDDPAGTYPNASHRAIILAGTTCNILLVNAENADSLVVESTAILNIADRSSLTLDNTEEDQSDIDGTVNLLGDETVLFIIDVDHTITGGGSIVGHDNAAEIDIDDGVILELQGTIEGHLTILGDTFKNSGIVHANVVGTLWVKPEVNEDTAAGTWRVSTSASATLL